MRTNLPDNDKSFCSPHELATLFVILIAIELAGQFVPFPAHSDILALTRACPGLTMLLTDREQGSLARADALAIIIHLYFTISVRFAQFGACFIYLMTFRRKSSAAMGLDFKDGLKSARIGIIASAIMGLLVFASAGLFFLIAGKNIFVYLGDDAHCSLLRAIVILIPTALIGPVIEEILFRAILYGSLRRMTGVRQAIIISALIFSGLHVTGYSGDPTGMIMIVAKTFAGGVIFACVYEKCGNIIGPSIVHGLGNAALFILPKLF